MIGRAPRGAKAASSRTHSKFVCRRALLLARCNASVSEIGKILSRATRPRYSFFSVNFASVDFTNIAEGGGDTLYSPSILPFMLVPLK